MEVDDALGMSSEEDEEEDKLLAVQKDMLLSQNHDINATNNNNENDGVVRHCDRLEETNEVDVTQSGTGTVSVPSAPMVRNNHNNNFCATNPSDAAAAANAASLAWLRYSYLLVIFVIMLADGLQGTHLYVLYEGYGYSVASLYCLGFVTGCVLSPVTGPLIDAMGRKRAAILYCALEILINALEQYPALSGLIVSRMLGGFTTNLLSTVWETWLDTEARQRRLPRSFYNSLLRHSVMISNLAAIGSGYFAHVLAECYGPVGPFRGAVTSTALALVVIVAVWTENYGSQCNETDDENETYDENNGDALPDDTTTTTTEAEEPTSRTNNPSIDIDHPHDKESSFFSRQTSSTSMQSTTNTTTTSSSTSSSSTTSSMSAYFYQAVTAFRGDSRMLRIGIIQALSSGSIQIFIFLWAPALRQIAQRSATASFTTTTHRSEKSRRRGR